jgi:NADH:ubiquinone oxidoreductase subunit K
VSFYLFGTKRLIILVQKLGLVGSVGIPPTILPELVHLELLVRPVASTLPTVELDHLHHHLQQQFVRWIHLALLEADCALKLAIGLVLAFRELFQALEA